MARADPTNRILGACFALSGLLVVMSAPAPALGPVLIGGASILAWIAFAVVPARQMPPVAVKAPHVPLRPPDPKPTLPTAPAPSRRMPAGETLTQGAHLPKIPSHRQRINDRRVRGSG